MQPAIVFSLVEDQATWNSFLLKHNFNTFLHSWQWGELQQQAGENVRYLGIFERNSPPGRGGVGGGGSEKGSQIGAALLITVNAKRGRFILCPHGPLFIHDELITKYLALTIEEIKKYAQQDSAVAIRLAPLLVSTSENNQLFKQLDFRPAPLHVHTELTWMLDITPDEKTLLKNMRKTTRQAIKKAEQQNISIEITTDPKNIKRFWPLYTTTSQRHKFVPFGKKFLADQLRIFSESNNCYTVFARRQNHDIAAAIFVHFGNTVFYHHGASLPLQPPLPAAQLLQWASIQEAKKRGATHYNFWGIAPENQPNHPFAGITIFKKGFGGYAVDYMHAQDLPLSLQYWKLWAIEQWRKSRRGF